MTIEENWEPKQTQTDMSGYKLCALYQLMFSIPVLSMVWDHMHTDHTDSESVSVAMYTFWGRNPVGFYVGCISCVPGVRLRWWFRFVVAPWTCDISWALLLPPVDLAANNSQGETCLGWQWNDSSHLQQQFILNKNKIQSKNNNNKTSMVLIYSHWTVALNISWWELPRVYISPFWTILTGPVLQNDARRGPEARLSQASADSLQVLPSTPGTQDQNELQWTNLLHLPHRQTQTDQR